MDSDHPREEAFQGISGLPLLRLRLRKKHPPGISVWKDEGLPQKLPLGF